MSHWYFSSGSNSERVGPLDDNAARSHAQLHPEDYCWRDGMGEWQTVGRVAELAGADGDAPASMPAMPSTGSGPGSDDAIDYRIIGTDMQFLEVELDPGESAIAEAGALVYKDATVKMDSVFGSGSPSGQGGLMGSLLSAGKRLVTGESLFTTVFTHNGQGKARVAFAAPFPGTVLPMKLSDHGGRLICQKDSFLAGARGVQVGIHFQKKILTGLFGGEGFVMQKLEGDGWVFVHAGGMVIEHELKAGERLDVDTGCVVAYHEGVDMDVQRVGGIKSMLFGGEGVFLATLTGPGKVWLQSLPFSRLAGRMLAAAPGGADKGEGSVLGGLGGLISGDRGF